VPQEATARLWLAALGPAAAPAVRVRVVREVGEALRAYRVRDAPLLLTALDTLATVSRAYPQTERERAM
jgi:hypothetical protein